VKYEPSNREKSRRPRGKRYWCDKCDANHVHSGEKCGVCGHKSGKKRDVASKANLSSTYEGKYSKSREI